MENPEKRHFRRHRVIADCELLLEGKKIRAKTTDYTPFGIGAIIHGRPSIFKNDFLDLQIESLSLRSKSRVVWATQINGSLRVGMKAGPEIQGRLKDYGLPDLLIGLQRSAKTGVLAVRSGNASKKIYVKNGDMVFSASNQSEDRLGDILLKEGKINKRQFDESSELIRKTGKRQGAILVEMGALKPHELPAAVRHQAEMIILSLFRVKDGEFEFHEVPLPTNEVITLKLSVADLIERGVKTIEDEEGTASAEVSFEESMDNRTEDFREVGEKIEGMFERHEALGYYGVLNLKETAAKEEVKRAFYRVAKEFHPDRHYYLPEDMKGKLHKIFIYITTAYSTLSNPITRKEYDSKKRKAAHLPVKATADEKLETGLNLLRAGKLSEAETLFAEAAYYDGSKALHHYYYGMALSGRGDFRGAEKALRRALGIEPENALYLAEAGHIYLGLDFHARARGCFERALKIQPSNASAKMGIEKLSALSGQHR